MILELSLKIENVGKSFKKNTVLKSINLEANGSDIIGLIGKSGCGKSTLLKILVGYHKPDSGRILLNGINILKDIKRKKIKLLANETKSILFYKALAMEYL